MKPDDIPEDVWREVELKIMPRDLVGSPLGELVHRNCCYGILAERARCALIADYYSGMPDSGLAVASAIRDGAAITQSSAG